MRIVILVLGAILVVLGGLTLVAPAAAQTTTVELRSGEVLGVDGNIVTARGPEGVKQFYVPEEFRFEMGGKEISVHELKPGMKVTAMVTVTETPVEVMTTEVREAEVVYTAGTTIVVRNLQTKELKKFTTEDLKDTNLVIYMDGKRVDVTRLKKGDKLSATIVTKQPPEILTEQELRVFVSQPPPTPTSVAAATPAPQVASAAAPAPTKLPKTGSLLPVLGLAGVVALGLGLGASALRGFMTRG